MIKFLEEKFIKDKSNQSAYVMMSGILGIILNTLLSSAKIIIGIIFASMSIVSDGLNNLSDMISALVEIISSKISEKRPDKEHPFGHGRMDAIGAVIVGFLIVIIGEELIKSAIQKLINQDGTTISFSYITIIILSLAILVKLFMYYYNHYWGNKIHNALLLATSKDSLFDVFTSLTILISVLLGNFIFTKNYYIIDSIVTIMVGVVIIINGVQVVLNEIKSLLGEDVSIEERKAIENIAKKEDKVLGVHDLSIHSYGKNQFAFMHVEVTSDLSLTEAHQIASNIEDNVKKVLGISLGVHIDPLEDKDDEFIKFVEILQEVVKSIDNNITFHGIEKHSGKIEFDIVIPDDYSARQIDEAKEKIINELKKKGVRNDILINIDFN